MEEEPQGNQNQGVEEEAPLSPAGQLALDTVMGEKAKVTPEDWARLMRKVQESSAAPGNWQTGEQNN